MIGWLSLVLTLLAQAPDQSAKGQQPAKPEPPQQLLDLQRQLDRARTSAERIAVVDRLELIRTSSAPETDRILALYSQGRAYLTLGDYDKATAAFAKVAAYRHTSGDQFGEALALHNQAAAFWSAGEPGKALAIYDEVLPIRKLLNDDAGVAYTQYGIAAAHYSMGQPAIALEAYRAAAAIWTRLKDNRGLAGTLSSMGLIYVQLGDAQRAEIELEHSLTLFRLLKDSSGEAYALNNLGLAALTSRDFNRALGYFTKALPILQTARDRRGESYALHNLGSAHQGLGRDKQAATFFETALARKRESEDRWGEATSLQALGEILRDRRYFEQALTIRRAVSDRAGLITTLASLARLDLRAGRVPMAKDEIVEAIGLVETTRDRLVSEDLRATWFSSQRDLYDLYIETLIRSGETERAFAIAESARGRLLVDRLRDVLADLRRSAPAALLAQEQLLARRINAKADQLRRLYSGPRSDAGTTVPERDLRVLWEQQKDLREAMRRASPQYRALLEPDLTAGQIQRLLDRDSLLIEIFPGTEAIHAWTATRDSVRYHRLPLTAKQPVDAKDGALLLTLSAEIRRVKPHRLIIAVEGDSEATSFAAIHLPGDPEPLAARYSLVFLPSAAGLELNRSIRKQNTGRILALVDPVYGAPDSRLPAGSGTPALYPRLRFSAAEGKTIAGLSSQARIASGFEATRAVLQQQSKAATILHLAAHTEVNGQEPRLSSVVLSQFDSGGGPIDGLMRLHEIYSLELHAKLVVLSACRSTGGAWLRGEGLMGIARGFLHAGAVSVLATVRDVEDRAAAEMITRFYTALLVRRLQPDKALQWAQNSMRTDPAWSSKDVWSAFALYGDWR
ncbi:MAG: CHAT domain-containing protein [Bryobacteraceae bacterium]|nr:CHAT domain-containing protein [Bryobacteraceae bacterium]